MQTKSTKLSFGRSAAMAAAVMAVGLVASAASLAADAGFAGDAGLTREQVRQELMEARQAGTLSLYGEAGDTSEVLAAREEFNAAQADAIMAGYIADQERAFQMAQSQERSAALQAQGYPVESMNAVTLEGVESIDATSAPTEAQPQEVRIDVIRLDLD